MAMDDDDNINLEDSDSSLDGGSSSRKSGGSGFLASLLKWIAIGIGAVIFIVTIVIITVRIIAGNNAPATTAPASDEYVGRRETLSWYDSLGQIRTTSSDVVPASIVVEVALGYTENNKNIAAEITSRSLEIKDWLRSYFRMKTIADLTPQKEARLKLEIRNGINDEILSKSKIREVLFKQLDVMEQ